MYQFQMPEYEPFNARLLGVECAKLDEEAQEVFEALDEVVSPGNEGNEEQRSQEMLQALAVEVFDVIQTAEGILRLLESHTDLKEAYKKTLRKNCKRGYYGELAREELDKS